MHLDSLTGQLVNLWSLRDIVVDLDSDPGGAILLETPWEELRIAEPSAALRTAVRRMTLGPTAVSNLLGTHGVDALLAELEPLEHLVIRTLAVGPNPVLSVVPISRQARFARLRPILGRACRLSRFAVIRHTATGLCIESPLLDHLVDLHHPQVLGRIGRIDGVPDDPQAPHDPTMEAIRAYLVAAGVLLIAETPDDIRSGTAATFAEDHDPALVGWSPDDLLVHAGSRRERLGRPRGAAFAHVGRMPPPPVVKPPASADRIVLRRPDPEPPLAAGPPLSAVLEREGAHVNEGGPLTVDHLGLLLHRAARVQRLMPPAPFDPAEYPTSERPYASIDAGYPLELYVVVGEGCCLPATAYHYDPLAHALERMEGAVGAASALAAAARAEQPGLGGPPSVMISITARLPRATYKFSGTAYCNVLKDVGALQQVITLVASAMGLDTRVLPVGDSDAFQHAVGLDWRIEPTVGEMLVMGRGSLDGASGGQVSCRPAML